MYISLWKLYVEVNVEGWLVIFTLFVFPDLPFSNGKCGDLSNKTMYIFFFFFVFGNYQIDLCIYEFKCTHKPRLLV